MFFFSKKNQNNKSMRGFMNLSELAFRLQSSTFNYLEERLGKELVYQIPTVEIPETEKKIQYPWKRADDLECDVVKFVLAESKKTGFAFRYIDLKTNKLSLEIILQKNQKENEWESIKKPKKSPICRDKAVSQENFDLIKNIFNDLSLEKTDDKCLPRNKPFKIEGDVFNYLEERLGKELVYPIPTLVLPETEKKIHYPWKKASDLESDVVKFVLAKSKKTGLAFRYLDIKTDKLGLEIILQKNQEEDEWESIKKPKKNSICKDKVVTQINFNTIKDLLSEESIEKTAGKFLPSKRHQVFFQMFKKNFNFFDDLPTNIVKINDISEIYSNANDMTFDGIKGILSTFEPFMIVRYFDIEKQQHVIAQIIQRCFVDLTISEPKSKKATSKDMPDNETFDFFITYRYDNGHTSPEQLLRKNHIREIQDLFAAKSLEETRGKYLPCYEGLDSYNEEAINQFLTAGKSPKKLISK